jgi:hypothetical protein
VVVEYLCLGSGDNNWAVKEVWVGKFAFSLFNHAAVGRGLRLFANRRGKYNSSPASFYGPVNEPG